MAATDEEAQGHGDEGGADGRPCPVAGAAEDAHEHDVQRHGDREGLPHGHVAQVARLDRPRRAGDRRGDGEGDELVVQGRHALDLRHVLVVMDGQQARPQARTEDAARHGERGERERESQEVDGTGHRRAELRDGDIAQVHTATPVERRVGDDGRQHIGHRERQQREELGPQALDAEHDEADAERQRGRDRRRRGNGQQKGHAPLAGQRGRRIDPGTEECRVAEAPVARIAAQDAPAGGQRDPEEDDIEVRQVEVGDACVGKCDQPGHRRHGRRTGTL